jgi:hypothetical protein
VGVREATLTHHLNAMDARGLITRTRDAASRRIHVVQLTEAGRGRVPAAAASGNRLRRQAPGRAGRCRPGPPQRPARPASRQRWRHRRRHPALGRPHRVAPAEVSGPHRHAGTGAPMPLRSAGAAAGQSPAMVTCAGCSTVNLWRIVAVCPPSSEISQMSSPRSFCSAGFGLVSRSRTLISPSVDTGIWS